MNEDKTKKIKILIWADGPMVPTGYGNVMRELSMGLYKTGKYEITYVAVNYRQVYKHGFPFFIYPLTNPNDPYGLLEIAGILQKEKPDIIFIDNDTFIMGETIPQFKMSPVEICKDIHPTVPIVAYFPVDGNSFSHIWGDSIIKKVDYTFTISKHGQRVIKDCTGLKVDTLPHGIDTKIYHPLDMNRILSLKRDQGWEDKFVIVNINRFQPRKGINIGMRVLNLFINGYKICGKCGNWFPRHFTVCDLNNCPGPYNEVKRKLDAVCYFHMNSSDPHNGLTSADTLGEIAITAGFPMHNNQVFKPNYDIYQRNLSATQVNNVYNVADVFFNTTLGEGFGLTTAEAMATQTSVIGPKNTTFFEICGRTCRLVDNSGFVAIGHDSGQNRPTIDQVKAVRALDEEYKKWISNGRKKVFNKPARRRIEKFFQWPAMVKKLDGAIDRVLVQPIKQEVGGWLGVKSE